MDKATLEKIEYARRLKSEGKYQQSLQVFRQVLQADPKNPYVLRSIGFVLVSQEKFAQSTKEFQKAVQINPDSAEGQMGLAISLMGLRRFDESLVVFQQEIQRYEKHSLTPPVGFYYNLGRVYQFKQDFGAAQESFRMALKIQPDYPNTHLFLGHVYLHQGNYDWAAREYREALRLDPALRNAKIGLITSLTLNKELGSELRRWLKGRA